MAGNIYHIEGDRYRLRYRDYTRNIRATSNREAEKLMAAFISEVEAENFDKPSKVTFEEFVKKYMKDYDEVELAPKTLYRYRQILESRILPVFGDMRLNKIKPLDITEFYNTLRKPHKYVSISKDGKREIKECDPLAELTIKHHHRILSAIFQKAIQWDVYKRSNPAKKVDAPKSDKKSIACLNEAQIVKMLEALEKVKPEELKYKVATMLVLTTGARLGEIIGLEWKDIHIDKKYIEVRQSRQYLPGMGVFTKKPKTESSKRRISVNNMLLELLETYKTDQRSKDFLCQDNNPIFVTWDGKPAYPYTMTTWFPKFLESNNLPRITFHGLRRTSATFLISKGMDIQTIAGRLGHSTSSTTQNIYSHFLEARDQQAAELMEFTFNKKESKTSKSEIKQ